MAEYAPLFQENGSVLPKNTQPLTSSQVTAALASTSIGAAAGASTVANRGQASHNGDNAGKRAIVSTSLINRNSAAADVTALKTELTRKNRVTKKKPSFGFVADKSGNGGPAFTRG